ncbi:Integrase catalytic domain-containing protein [Citrus sinensis]|nr:Integrase catalytic domain-containing protein [Citrus sinensis]
MAEASSSSSSSLARTTVTNAKFEVEKFDGTNNFDLLNLDENFEDEDKALLLLNSLPDEYDHLTTTLLHRKDNVMFDVVCSALYNSETRKKDKKDHRDTIAKALTARGRSQSRKLGKRNKSKGRPAKNECAFCQHDEESDFSLVGMTLICHSDEWILDSGCTYHMCPNKGWSSSFKELDGGVVFMGNDNACKTMGIGTIQLKNHDGSIQVLTDVRYVPSLKKNLISLGVLESKGRTITLRDELLKVVAGALTVMKDTKRNNLYYFQGSTVIGSASTVSGKDANSEAIKLWHTRLGHTGEKALQTLAKQGLLKEIMDYVHNDVWGPTKTASLGEENDRDSDWSKGQRFRLDNDGEYKNDPFLQICQDEGIVRHFTIRDTPQQNRVAKRMNQTILEKVRCMLSNAGLNKEFWVEAVVYACHLINCLPSTVIEGRTPMEMWIFQEDDKTSSTLQHVEFEKVKADLVGVDETNSDSPSTEDDEEVLTQEPSQQQDSIAYRRPRREIHRLARFVDMVAYALLIVDDDVPSTYREAISNPKNAEREYMLQVPYSNAVGSLMYAMVCTRPDISHAVGIMSKYMHNHGKGHWQAMQWILRYIQKTVDVGLLFERDDTLGQGVIGYVDSDYAGDLEKRRSTIRYVFTFSGGPISWKSTL